MGGLLLLAGLIKLSLALEQSEPQSVPRRKPWLSSGVTAPPAAHSLSLLQDLLLPKGCLLTEALRVPTWEPHSLTNTPSS